MASPVHKLLDLRKLHPGVEKGKGECTQQAQKEQMKERPSERLFEDKTVEIKQEDGSVKRVILEEIRQEKTENLEYL